MQNYSYDIYVYSYNYHNTTPVYFERAQAKLDSVNINDPIDSNFFTFLKTIDIRPPIDSEGVHEWATRRACITVHTDIVNKSLYNRRRNRAIQNNRSPIPPPYNSNLSENICFKYWPGLDEEEIEFPDNVDPETEKSDIFGIALEKFLHPSENNNGIILLECYTHQNNSWDLLVSQRRQRPNLSFNNRARKSRARKSRAHKRSKSQRKSRARKSRARKRSKSRRKRSKSRRKRSKSRRKSQRKRSKRFC